MAIPNPAEHQDSEAPSPRPGEDTILARHPGTHLGSRYPRTSRGRGPRWAGYTAFVLSGGGARGALQAGALRALIDYGERPDVVVGTSIGAWNGAWIARDPTPAGAAELEDTWRKVTASQILLGRELPGSYPSQALAGMLLVHAARRLLRGASSLYSDEGVRHYLSGMMGEGTTFEDMSVPLRIVATNLTHGTRAVLSSGEVVPAMMASSAIPGIFPPVHIGEATYGDGGTLDVCSLETARQMGARRIFLLAIGHDTDGDGGELWQAGSEDEVKRGHIGGGVTNNLAAVLERASQVLGHYQLERALEALPRGIETHVIPLSSGNGYGMFDFHNIEQWLEQGYETAMSYLRDNVPPSEQRPHTRRDEIVTRRTARRLREQMVAASTAATTMLGQWAVGGVDAGDSEATAS